MTTTPTAPGVDLATERALFETWWATQTTTPTLGEFLAWKGWEARAALAAVPASEPPSECRWPNCESEATQQALAKEVAESLFGAAAPAPVSGMPDLARLIEVGNRMWYTLFNLTNETRSATQIALLGEWNRAAIPAPQAPDTQNPTGETK